MKHTDKMKMLLMSVNISDILLSNSKVITYDLLTETETITYGELVLDIDRWTSEGGSYEVSKLRKSI